MNEVDVRQKAREEEERKLREQERLADQMRTVDMLGQYRKREVINETTSVQKAAERL